MTHEFLDYSLFIMGLIMLMFKSKNNNDRMLAILLYSSCFEMLYIDINNYTIRYYQAIFLVDLLINKKMRKQMIINIKYIKSAIPFITIFVFSTINSLNPLSSIRMLFLFLVLITFYIYIITRIQSTKSIDITYKLIRYVSLLVMIISLIQFILIRIGFLPIYRSDMLFFGARMPGPFEEAAWLGSFIIYFIILELFYNKKYGIYLFFSFLILLLSFARSAWLGFIITVFVILFYYMIRNRRVFNHIISKNLLFLILFTIPIILITMFGSKFIDDIYSRFNLNNDINRSSVESRLFDYEIALIQIKDNLILGNGAATIGDISERITQYRRIPNVISNIFISILYDGGILLLISFIYFIYKYYKNISNSYGVSKYNKVVLMFSITAVLISFFFSNGFYRGWFWFLLAFSYYPRYYLINNKVKLLQQ